MGHEKDDALTTPVTTPATTTLEDFDQAKSYIKYFVSSNIERVLKRFNPLEKKTSSIRKKKLNRRSSCYPAL